VAARRIVVIGASSGGIEALETIVSRLPAGFPAPICVVVHTSPEAPGVLDFVLRQAGPLAAINAASGDRLEDGHIYVAPPDHHLLVEPGQLRLTRGPKENRFRPAIDPLFRSAAQVFGPGAIGVVLTGQLDDGTAGLWTIKQLGGVAIVQDPSDARYPSMPESAIRHVAVDYVVRLDELAATLSQVVAEPVHARKPTQAPKSLAIEVAIARQENAVESGVEELGEPSSFACPDCQGVLLQLKESPPLRFRCHTGHAYSVQSLVAAINDGIEDSLWSAIRALEEGALLMEQLGRHLQEHRDLAAAEMLAEQARGARAQSNELRRIAGARQPLTAVAE
jgi:two-component system chemotaxis response regulator CheB